MTEYKPKVGDVVSLKGLRNVTVVGFDDKKIICKYKKIDRTINYDAYYLSHISPIKSPEDEAREKAIEKMKAISGTGDYDRLCQGMADILYDADYRKMGKEVSAGELYSLLADTITGYDERLNTVNYLLKHFTITRKVQP